MNDIVISPLGRRYEYLVRRGKKEIHVWQPRVRVNVNISLISIVFTRNRGGGAPSPPAPLPTNPLSTPRHCFHPSRPIYTTDLILRANYVLHSHPISSHMSLVLIHPLPPSNTPSPPKATAFTHITTLSQPTSLLLLHPPSLPIHQCHRFNPLPRPPTPQF